MANNTITQFPTGASSYKVTFEYLARPFVVITLMDTTKANKNKVLKAGEDYTFTNSTTVVLSTSWQGYDVVQIHRYTDTDLVVDFRDGSVLTAGDLTSSELQAIHIAEEGRDLVSGYIEPAVSAIEDGIEAVKDDMEETKRIHDDTVKAISEAGDASTLVRLALEDGASLIGGSILVVPDFKDVPRIKPKDGQHVRTLSYNGPVTTDWLWYKSEPVSETRYYVPCGDGWLVYLGEIFDFCKVGLMQSSTYTFESAWFNTKLLRKGFRNKRYSTFIISKPAKYFIVSSVNPCRDNFSFHIPRGVKIVGHYHDKREPLTWTQQSGGMFDITPRVDPDSGDFTVLTEFFEDITIYLDGDVSSIYDPDNNTPHTNNNNCFGMHHVRRVYVIGTGGVSTSDHRGINYDGDCEDCFVDIGYVKDTADESLCMGVNAGTYGSIKVGLISGLGNVAGRHGLQLGVRVSGSVTGGLTTGGHVKVDIGRYMWNGKTKYPVVGAYGTKTCDVTMGVCTGSIHVIRWANSESVSLKGGTYYRTDSLVARAYQGTGIHKTSHIEGVRAGDIELYTALLTEAAVSKQVKSTIVNCDFSKANPNFTLYYDLVTSNTPSRYPELEQYEDNQLPDGFVGRTWSPITGYASGNLVRSGATTVSLDPATLKYIAPIVEVVAYEGSTNSSVMFSFDMRQRMATSSSLVHRVRDKFITSSVANKVVSLTCDSGVSLQIVQIRGI